MTWFALHYHGGGADIVCGHCRSSAVAEQEERGSLISVAPVDPGGDDCAWCGRRSGEEGDL